MKKLVFRARPLWLIAATSVLSSHSFIARSQVPPFELQPVTVTGSGMPRSLGSEIAATSVLTRGDIERAGARDAVQVLNLLGTALVEQQGGPGTLASIRIRGADSRDTLVLIDGIPMTDVTSGQALIEQIPAEMIERVEVVRGNLSALYGANATGGVVQIFTRRGEPGRPASQASVGAGSRGTSWANASIGFGSERLRARVGAGTERTDGFSAANPATAPNANPDRDGNERHHATISLDAQFNPGHRISIDMRRVEGTVQYDSIDSFSTPQDVHAQHLVQTGTTLSGQHALSTAWSVAWRIARSKEQRTDYGSTNFGPFEFGNSIHNDVDAIELNGVPMSGWRVQMAAERLAQSTDIPSYLRQRRDTDVWRAGAVHEATWGSIQANVRHDRTSDFGAASTALVGGSLKLGGGLSAIASASSSFTPPTLDFLFYDCSPFVCSNPGLRPEKAHNVEAGLQWQDARNLMRATLFSVRYRDKIANDANFVPQNVARAKNDGMELSLRHDVDGWTLLGEATFQNPIDESTGERLIRRARQQLALRADRQSGHWHAGAGLRFVGNRPDTGGVSLPSYTVLDASARWQMTPQWSVQARADNLLGRHYEPVAGYNGVPRGVFIGVQWLPQ